MRYCININISNVRKSAIYFISTSVLKASQTLRWRTAIERPVFFLFFVLDISLSGTLQSRTSLYWTPNYSVSALFWTEWLNNIFYEFQVCNSSYFKNSLWRWNVHESLRWAKLYCVQLILLKQHFTVSTHAPRTTLVSLKIDYFKAGL